MILDAFILIIHEIIYAHVCYLSTDRQWMFYNADHLGVYPYNCLLHCF